jgi:hypothetical protein
MNECTNEQLRRVAGQYVALMRARGITIGTPEEQAILRMAAIQDVWRVAFGRVLGSQSSGGDDHES